MPKYSFILFLIFFSSKIHAQNFDFNQNLQKAYSEICQFKIQSARQILARENPKNGIKIYLDDFADMIMLLNSENKAEYEKLKNKEDERIESLEELDSKSPYNRFLRAEVKLHWLLLKYRFGSEVKAAWNFVQAYKLLEENRKQFPNFVPSQKSLGAVHIILGALPDNFTWVTKLLGLRGNIQQGQKELQNATKDPIFGAEAEFYDLFLSAYVLRFNEQKNQQLLKYLDEHKTYLSVNFISTAISIKDNRSEQAHEILNKRPLGTEYLLMPMFDFYKGEIALQKGAYNQAINSYNNYLKNFKGKSFLKESYFKIFAACWLNNETDKAMLHLNKIPQVGNTIADGDKSAQKFYENYQQTKQLPNKTLTKARFAFDGGFIEKAIDEIESISEKSLTNQREKAEYNYRRGRIYQKSNQIDKAIGAYNRAIQLSEGQDWHFGASSCLQLGYISKEKNDKPQAKKYFEKALAYGKHESKYSVDNRAKAALTEMGF